MADKERTDELSMETYFQNGLQDDQEPNNPFEPAKQEKHAKARSSKIRKLSGAKPGKLKRILIVAGIAAAIILIIVIVAVIQRRRNDGVRISSKISAGLGGPIGAINEMGGVDISGQSKYAVINGLLPAGSFVTESRKECKVEGVNLPQWTIVCETDDSKLTSVTYYHYELLEKNYLGTERKSYLDPKTVPSGADIEKVESFLGLEPYSITYLADKSQQREYRYCFKDAETGDRTSYIITAVWNETGILSLCSDTRVDFLAAILKPRF